ncbi:MAG: hypothetical protein ACR2OO_09055 [Thermomicrobiales bacterium]
MTTFIFLVNAAATFSMLGLIWFVQVVHYPLFAETGGEAFARYAAEHSRLTTLVVSPPMVAELVTAVYLVWERPDGVGRWVVWAGLGLVGVVWLATALLSVPRHASLGAGFDHAEWSGLVRSNWVRTVAWSLRGLLVFAMLWQALP